MKITLASKVTLLRIAMIPLFVWSYYAFSAGDAVVVPALLFVIASSTDFIDGYLARSRDEVTNFGKFIDPIADKLLVMAAFVLLVGDGRLSAVSCVIFLGREFIISGFRLIASDRGVVIAAGQLGKIKTATQSVAIVIALLNNYPFSLFTDIRMDQIAMFVALVFTIWSGIDYILRNWHVLAEGNEDA